MIRRKAAQVRPAGAIRVAGDLEGRFPMLISRNAALALAVLPFLAGAAFADGSPRTITVSGHGEASATPDSAVISAGVTTIAKTAAAALSANASAMQNVFAALKRLGIPDEHVQTTNFNVEPQYAPYDSNVPASQRITGYQVSNQVTVTIDHVANVGPTIDALTGAGANQMNGISFTIHDPKPLLEHARGDAVDDAVMRAKTLTAAAHMTLGPILSISEGGGEGPRPVFAALAQMKAAPTPVAAGTQTISADVSITWEIQ
jgi:uncharacterized protein YggE